MNLACGNRSLPSPGTLDVLFVAYGGGHIQAVLPVAKMLQEKGCSVSLFAITTAIAVAAASGLPYFSYSDLPQANEPEVIGEGNRLAAAFPPGGPIPLEETRAYLGINYIDLVGQHGSDRSRELYETGGRQNFFPLQTMTGLLEELKPKLVIATNSPRSEQAALQAASGLGIPSLCIVDMFALQEIAWLKAPGFATKVCVLNDAVKDMFVRNGRPADEIEVTGNPAFDGIFDPVVIGAGLELRKSREWGQGRFTLLYASSPEPVRHPFTGEVGDPALPMQVEERLRAIVRDNPNLELVLRRHPSEAQDIELSDRVFASYRSEDVNTLINAVDMVVVTCSTVGLQAYLAGVPVVSVECSVISKDAPFGEFGMSRRVGSVGALETVLLEEVGLYRDRARTTTIQITSSPQRATVAVCEQALQLLHQRTHSEE